MFRRFILSACIALTIAGAALVSAQPSQAQGLVCTQVHLVQRGETLSRIARMYSTSVASLTSINAIFDPNRIYAGQVLCVSQGYSSVTSYVVQRGDTLSSIARRYGISMSVLAQVNNIANPNRIFAGQVLAIPQVTIQ